MSEWKEYKLGAVAEYISRGITPSYSEDGVIVINQKCIRDGRVSYEQARYTDTSKKKIASEKFLKHYDIVINSTGQGSLGRVGQVKEVVFPTTIDSHVTIVRAKNNFNPKFLGYLLKSKQEIIEGLAEGSTGQTELSKHRLSELNIFAPPLPTQTAIAEILSSLDDKIELNNAINKNLEELAQTLFKQWFVDFEFPDENGQPYKSSGGEMMESELGVIPKGWRVSCFKDHVNVSRGLSYKGEGLTDSMNGTPMVNLNSIYEGGGFKHNGFKYYKGDYKEKHVIRPWDLAVANTEQGHKYLLIGFPAFVPRQIGEYGIFSHHIYRVTTKNVSILSHQFLYYLMLQPAIREQIIGACNGTTVNMLKIHGLESPKYALPKLETVNIFSQIVKHIWEMVETNIDENTHLISLRDNLLPKLITGKLEVSQHDK